MATFLLAPALSCFASLPLLLLRFVHCLGLELFILPNDRDVNLALAFCPRSHALVLPLADVFLLLYLPQPNGDSSDEQKQITRTHAGD